MTDSRNTILLVEDLAPLREMTAMLLRAYGFEVIEAEDGEDALAKWPRLAGEVDLILTDVFMPGMSGVDMISAMSKGVGLGAARVLFVSGDDRTIVSCQSPHHFLEKPYRLEELLSKVKFLVGELIEPNQGIEAFSDIPEARVAQAR